MYCERCGAAHQNVLVLYATESFYHNREWLALASEVQLQNPQHQLANQTINQNSYPENRNCVKRSIPWGIMYVPSQILPPIWCLTWQRTYSCTCEVGSQFAIYPACSQTSWSKSQIAINRWEKRMALRSCKAVGHRYLLAEWTTRNSDGWP